MIEKKIKNDTFFINFNTFEVLFITFLILRISVYNLIWHWNKKKIGFFDGRNRLKKIVGNINSRSILGERRQNQKTVWGKGSSYSEAVWQSVVDTLSGMTNWELIVRAERLCFIKGNLFPFCLYEIRSSADVIPFPC